MIDTPIAPIMITIGAGISHQNKLGSLNSSITISSEVDCELNFIEGVHVGDVLEQ